MLAKTSAALVTALILASASHAFAAQNNRFDFDPPNSTFPTPTDKGLFEPLEGWLP